MTHAELVAIAVRWARSTRRCKVVLTERGQGERCDVIAWAGMWSRRPTCVVIEVKVHLDDFFDDLNKPHRKSICPETLLGDERWYFAPTGLIPSDRIPAPWGLVEFDGSTCRIAQKAHKIERSHERHQIVILARELQRYQIHGITYPPLNPAPPVQRRAEFAAHEQDVREARQLMRLEARP